MPPPLVRGEERRADVFSSARAAFGESLAILGWNMAVANLRFDADYVLVDVEASPSQEGAAHAEPGTSGSASTVRWRIRSSHRAWAAAKT